MLANFRRKTAIKNWIGNINKGKPVFDAGRFIGIQLSSDQGSHGSQGSQGMQGIVSRVNIIANVIDKFQGENFTILTLDDSTGIIEVRDFENKLDNIEIGDVVLAIGMLKSYNEKIYIAREIVKKVHPLWIIARKLELEKIFGLRSDSIDENERKRESGREVNEENEKKEKNENETQQSFIKEKILNLIKKFEEEGKEATTEEIFLQIAEPIDKIKEALNELIEEASIYEPKPGVLKIF